MSKEYKFDELIDHLRVEHSIADSHEQGCWCCPNPSRDAAHAKRDFIEDLWSSFPHLRDND